jgi:hypothetical protein
MKVNGYKSPKPTNCQTFLYVHCMLVNLDLQASSVADKFIFRFVADNCNLMSQERI